MTPSLLLLSLVLNTGAMDQEPTLRQMEEQIRLARASGNRYEEASWQLSVALHHEYEKNYRPALTALNQVIAIAVPNKYIDLEGKGRAVLGEIYAYQSVTDQNKRKAARRELDLALPLLRRSRIILWEAGTHITYAKYHQFHKEHRQAIPHLERAITLSRLARDPESDRLPEALDRLATSYEAIGNRRKATELHKERQTELDRRAG